ncbi:TetR/AcrR family transcriptional regulator [Actinoplanes sp. NPDC051861]|uniref:TetR/AcrR family transcriptional regulator n=1 Tax=Actinoplanes sp. NPDC051861 TaxID=3155170 RepID=UPI00343EEF32
MVRLTRAQQQERTRASVLFAAAAEFAEWGYAEAKVDRIAERAEMTRGAVYSNFPSKRSLYLAVLLDALQSRHVGGFDTVPEDVAAAGEAFARVWLERLPLAGDSAAAARFRSLSVTGVFDDEPGRAVQAQLIALETLLLALRLETCRPRAARRVRLAELMLTLLTGADHLAETAAGFGDPFEVARACRYLAAMEGLDSWDPPHLPFIAPAVPCSESWDPPSSVTDAMIDGPVGLGGDGVVLFLGARRLGGAEEAVRAVRPGDSLTVVLVGGDPVEVGALVRLRVSDLALCLRRVFGPGGLGTVSGVPVRVVLDEGGVVAAAAGLSVGDDTEEAVRVRGGRIVARARGRGAGHAAAVVGGESEG